MRSRIHRKQALLAYMSVDLCGLQAGVTQQFLHHPQVGAPVQQVGGEAVAEGVGVGGDRRPPVEEPPDVPGAEPLAPPVVEQGSGWAALGGPWPTSGPCSQARTASAHRSWMSTWRCLDALAGDRDHPPGEVDVGRRRGRTARPPAGRCRRAAPARRRPGDRPRGPRADGSAGGSSSRPSSAWPSTRGRRESGAGADRRADGSASTRPRLAHHRKYERSEAAVRAMVAFEYRRVARKAR